MDFRRLQSPPPPVVVSAPLPQCQQPPTLCHHRHPHHHQYRLLHNLFLFLSITATTAVALTQARPPTAAIIIDRDHEIEAAVVSIIGIPLALDLDINVHDPIHTITIHVTTTIAVWCPELDLLILLIHHPLILIILVIPYLHVVIDLLPNQIMFDRPQQREQLAILVVKVVHNPTYQPSHNDACNKMIHLCFLHLLLLLPPFIEM